MFAVPRPTAVTRPPVVTVATPGVSLRNPAAIDEDEPLDSVACAVAWALVPMGIGSASVTVMAVVVGVAVVGALADPLSLPHAVVSSAATPSVHAKRNFMLTPEFWTPLQDVRCVDDPINKHHRRNRRITRRTFVLIRADASSSSPVPAVPSWRPRYASACGSGGTRDASPRSPARPRAACSDAVSPRPFALLSVVWSYVPFWFRKFIEGRSRPGLLPRTRRSCAAACMPSRPAKRTL
jgi:hypothetical protein